MSKQKTKGEKILGTLPATIIWAEEHSFGREMYSMEGFTFQKEYHPIGMFLHRFEDGGVIPCFIVPDDSGRIQTRAVTKFLVR